MIPRRSRTAPKIARNGFRISGERTDDTVRARRVPEFALLSSAGGYTAQNVLDGI